MAKRPLKSFTVQIVDHGMEVEIVTDRQKPYRYLICKDTIHPDVREIARHLEVGLNKAKETLAKVGISEFLERNYVSIELPIKTHPDRYTAHKLSACAPIKPAN
jgi:hypothetical protein